MRFKSPEHVHCINHLGPLLGDVHEIVVVTVAASGRVKRTGAAQSHVLAIEAVVLVTDQHHDRSARLPRLIERRGDAISI